MLLINLFLKKKLKLLLSLERKKRKQLVAKNSKRKENFAKVALVIGLSYSSFTFSPSLKYVILLTLPCCFHKTPIYHLPVRFYNFFHFQWFLFRTKKL